MKAIVVITMVMVVACANVAVCQQSSMYDTRYSGPMNVYGQPVLTVPNQQQPSQAGQPRQATGGIIPTAASGMLQVGEYFWSYMPAPVRGVDSPYAVPPGSGQVITNFTPGSR